MKIGFITGTGFYSLPNLKDVQKETVSTPYGNVEMELGSVAGQEAHFIARHGKKHTILPDDINYRANLYAMHLMDVKIILATSVSGSLNIDWGPGSYILLEQFLNFSNGRKDTFYPLDSKLAHVDVTDPYCMETHKYLRQAAEDIGLNLCRGGVYSCFNGPRFETKAEIEMVRRLGGNLVGQTGYPECVLARELAISYASVAVVSNMAAGIEKELTVQEVSLNLENLDDIIAKLFQRTLELIPEDFDAPALHALDEAFV